MVTTKRQIRRDSDRFGGYYTAEADAPRISDYDSIGLEPITESERTGSSMLVSDGVQEMQQPIYTTPQMAAAPAPAAPEVMPIPERPVRPVQPRNKEDLLPTVKTRAYATEKPAQDTAEKVEKAPAKRAHASLDTKTKILLCVYVIVALVLAIAVIATGVSISNASAAADEIAASVAQKQAVIVRQEQELALLQDSDAIRGKAVQLGMVPAGAPAYSVSPVETVGYPEATERTDGWDKFFDFFSKVFN
ncbi:MAG: hypothetical protein K2O04_04415 [Clostridiales bacterium]|nr:hypothetical protein [Clostridiales bacterium]